MPADADLFQPVLDAMDARDFSRARDLLTRLLQREPHNAKYWVYLSACVDTPKEQVYCLKEALKWDPENLDAKRGLIALGEIPSDPALMIPFSKARRNWKLTPTRPKVEAPKRNVWQDVLLYGGVFLLVAALAALSWFGARQIPATQPTPRRLASTLTPTITTTPAPNATPLPLAARLIATYTPTPLLVTTPHTRVEAYAAGIRAYQRNDWAKTIEYMQQVLSYEPEAADAYYYIGEANRMQGKASTALSAYADALKLNPDFAAAYLGRGRAKLQSSASRTSEAARDFEQALALDPYMGEAWLELAAVELTRNDPEAALEDLEQAADLLPGSPSVYYLRAQANQALDKPEEALADVRQARTLDITLLDAYRLEGEILVALDRVEEAITTLETYLAYEPKDAQALAWLGTAYARQGDTEQALELLDRAATLDKRQADVFLLRGNLYLETGEGQKALDDFNAVLRLRATSFAGMLGKARAYLLLGHPGTTYETLNQTQAFAKTDAEWAELYYYRAQSLELINQNRAAINDWNALLALPEGSAKPEWLETAQERLTALQTPTPTP